MKIMIARTQIGQPEQPATSNAARLQVSLQGMIATISGTRLLRHDAADTIAAGTRIMQDWRRCAHRLIIGLSVFGTVCHAAISSVQYDKHRAGSWACSFHSMMGWDHRCGRTWLERTRKCQDNDLASILQTFQTLTRATFSKKMPVC